MLLTSWETKLRTYFTTFATLITYKGEPDKSGRNGRFASRAKVGWKLSFEWESRVLRGEPFMSSCSVLDGKMLVEDLNRFPV